MIKPHKVAVILFTMGGPDSPQDVQPFLYNLFSDPAIIRLPSLWRQGLAWLISRFRADKARHNYKLMGGGSPLLVNTKAQASALEQALQLLDMNFDFKCFVCMRYWHPRSQEIAQAIGNFDPEYVVFLPLYPQWSSTTTETSFNDLMRVMPVKLLCCQEASGNDGFIFKINEYPDLPEFIKVISDHIIASCATAASYGCPLVLLSAHGLPEKIVQAGDTYPQSCAVTVQAIIDYCRNSGGAAANAEFRLCYQSQVGRMKWTEPYTDAEIIAAGRAGRPVVLVPIAFVSEHVETLVEMDVEYRQLAANSGVPYFDRVATVGTDPQFVAGLARLVLEKLGK